LASTLTDDEIAELSWLVDASASPDVTRAACAGLPTRVFVPDDDEPPDPKYLAICERCPVHLECLASTLRCEEPGYRSGWFGGYNPLERDEIAAACGLPTEPVSAADLRRAVVERLAKLGRTQREIAEELGVSRKTVQRDVAALRRLQCRHYEVQVMDVRNG
jgi:hypothetical protein